MAAHPSAREAGVIHLRSQMRSGASLTPGIVQNRTTYLNIFFYNNIMNHIILSSSLLGSIFLFSTSLILTNRALLEDKKVSNGVFIINGLTMLASGSIIVAYNYSLLSSFHFKSARL